MSVRLSKTLLCCCRDLKLAVIRNSANSAKGHLNQKRRHTPMPSHIILLKVTGCELCCGKPDLTRWVGA